MKMRSTAPMWVAKTGYIALSVFFIAAGALFIAFPAVSSNLIGRALGIALTVFGVVKLIGYFSKDLFRLAFQYDLEFGILLAALGVIVLLKPDNVMNFLFIALGIAILTDGLFKIRIAAEARSFGIGSWWLTMLLAVLTAAVGLVLIFRPTESRETMTVLLGLSLLAEGGLNLAVALSTVKIVKNQYPDVIEGEFTEKERDAR